MAKNKVEVVLSLLDKASAPFQAFNKRLAAMQAPVQQINNKLMMLGRESGIGRINDQLGNVSSAAGNVAGQLARVGVAGVGAGFLFKRAFIDVAAEFERFETILTTIEGSSAKAKQSMNWISDFSAKTPYELTEVTEAFVKLRAYGMEPTKGLLKSLGDTSAAMGKPLMAAIEAIADAVTGENERLKEFGIKAKKTGDKIVYEYTENGKTMRAQAKASNRAQIQATLEAIFNKKYAGAMDKLSMTWGGMMSNIGDQWTRFAKMVMDSGPFEILRGKLAAFLAKLDEMAKNGELAKIAAEWGAKISTAFTQIWETGTKLFNLLQSFVSMVGGIENAMMLLAAVAAGPLLLSLVMLGKAFIGLGAAMLLNPIGLVITGLALMVAGIVWAYKHWDELKALMISLWDAPSKALDAFVKFASDKLGWLFKYSPIGLILSGTQKLNEAFSGLMGSSPAASSGGALGAAAGATGSWGSPGAPAGINTMTRGAVGAQNTTNTVTNNAKVEVDFKNVPRGVEVKPSQQGSAPVDLTMGYSMAVP